MESIVGAHAIPFITPMIWASYDTYFVLDDTLLKIEEGDKFKRNIQIDSIRALTQSNEEDNEQLIIHVTDDFDLIL